MTLSCTYAPIPTWSETSFNNFSNLLPTMRLGRTLSSLILCFLPGYVEADPAPVNGSLDPPGLLPLINRANALLSAGQFNEAARTYSEAIGESVHPLSCGLT